MKKVVLMGLVVLGMVLGTKVVQATGSVTVLNPVSGPVGQQVTFQGIGFDANTLVRIDFGTKLTITTTTSSANGTFSITFLVNAQPGRTVTITATGKLGEQASSQFYILPSIILPLKGRCNGIMITVCVTGFGGTETLNLIFGDRNVLAYADIHGRCDFNFTPYYRPAGTITITVMPESEHLCPPAIHFATTTYCIMSGIDIAPSTGKIGSVVKVKGDGFGASEVVHILFGTHQTLTTVIADSQGSFSDTLCTFVVQTAPFGNNPITAKGAGFGFMATASFFVLPGIFSLKPASGGVGDVVSVSGRGYGSSSLIAIHFGTTATISTSISGVDGIFLATFIVDIKPSGTYTITASDSSGYEVTTGFILLPSVILMPTSGYVGANMEVFGSGFDTYREVRIDFGTHQTITTTTSSDVGTFSATFKVSAQPPGTKVITIQDTLGNLATTTFFIIPPNISVSPSSGLAGIPITVCGSLFFENSLVAISFGTYLTITTIQTNQSGTFSTTFKVSAQPPGTKVITIQDTLGNLATTTFFIVPSNISVLPSSGFTGTGITVCGSLFFGDREVIIDFSTNKTITTIQSSTNGTFSVTFLVPTQPAGTKVIIATDTFGNKATTTFFIISQITQFNPSFGLIGTLVTIQGTGFSVQSVSIHFGTHQTITTATANANGTFSTIFKVSAQPPGTKVITIQDTLGNLATTTFFIILSNISVSPSSGLIGTKVTVQSSSFFENSLVSISFGTHPTITTTQSSNNGTFSATFIADTQTFGTVVITAKDESGNLATASFLLKPKTSLLLAPESSSIASGTTFSINVDIQNIENLVTGEAHLDFDPALISVESIAKGNFLPDGECWLASRFNNTQGTIATIFGVGFGHDPFTGSGTLAIITFRAVGSGTGEILFSFLPPVRETYLVNSSGARIPFDYNQAGVQVRLLHRIQVTPGSVTAVVGTTQSFQAQGYDVNGNPLSDLAYSWQVHGNIGMLSNDTGSVTTLTAGTATCSGSITVSSSGVSTYTLVFLTHATPVSINLQPGSVTITAGDTINYSSTAKDTYQNQWDVTSLTSFVTTGGGAFYGSQFLGTITGIYQVTGDYSGLSDMATVTINHATPTSLYKVSGDGQVSTATSILSPMVVRVDDSFGNPVGGLQIGFSIDSVPQNAQGQAINPAVSETSSNGTASTILTLGDRKGIYQVKASAQVIPATVTFTATASQWYGSITGKVVVDLIDGFGTWAVTVTLVGVGTTNTNGIDGGFIFIDVIPNATYTITANTAGASPGTTNIYIPIASNVDIGTLTLIGGDADSSGVVGAMDFWIMWKAFFVYNAEADFNHDGTVDASDFLIFLDNIFKGRGKAVSVAGPRQKGEEGVSLLASSSRNGVKVEERFDVTVALETNKEALCLESEIVFDQNILKIVDIKKEGLGWSAESISDGRASFISGINLGESLKKGRFTLLTITFEAVKPGEAYISFSPSIMATEKGQVICSTPEPIKIMVTPQTPLASALFQSFPNPTEKGCWIPYQLAEEGDVSLTLYNILGQKVREIGVGHKTAGFYLKAESALFWDGKNDSGQAVASGIYFYKFSAGRFSATKSMVITK
ncbi:MAG: T9SS type A sorting domain-containing protein [bacterium]